MTLNVILKRYKTECEIKGIDFKQLRYRPCNCKQSTGNDKKDKDIHGLGLKSVLSKIHKYEGDIYWEYIKDKKTFITTAIIKDISETK